MSRRWKRPESHTGGLRQTTLTPSSRMPASADARRWSATSPASWRRGRRIPGETTSGAWGYRVGASIALGVVRADCATPGTGLEVEIFGERFKATVQPDRPLWDPENERLKA